MAITDCAGTNFQVAKFAAILIVATAHFFPDTVLWVPSTMSLFVFGFSSGYFTHLKYGSRLDISAYTLNKVARLAIPLVVINSFLLLILSVTSSRSVWVWQTGVHLVGLSAFLDWLGIPNVSPLGNGVWFLTVLFIFYALYPVLRSLSTTAGWRYIVGSAALAVVYLQSHVPLGYDLWLTSFSFVYGVHMAGHPPKKYGNAYGLGCAAALTGVAVLRYGLRNTEVAFVLMFTGSACLVLWLREAALPDWAHTISRYGSDILLEIYLLHTYLFVSLVGWKPMDYAVSLLLIFVVAKGLRALVVQLEQWSDLLLVIRRPSHTVKAS